MKTSKIAHANKSIASMHLPIMSCLAADRSVNVAFGFSVRTRIKSIPKGKQNQRNHCLVTENARINSMHNKPFQHKYVSYRLCIICQTIPVQMLSIKQNLN